MAKAVKIIVNGREATRAVKISKPYKNEKNYSYDKEVDRLIIERSKKENNVS